MNLVTTGIINKTDRTSRCRTRTLVFEGQRISSCIQTSLKNHYSVNRFTRSISCRHRIILPDCWRLLHLHQPSRRNRDDQWAWAVLLRYSQLCRSTTGQRHRDAGNRRAFSGSCDLACFPRLSARAISVNGHPGVFPLHLPFHVHVDLV